jgi:ribonuclease HI
VEWRDSGLWGIDELPDHWVMYFDGSYTLKGVGVGVMFIPPEGDALRYAIQLEFPATNNIAEYERLVNSLRLAKDLGIRQLLIKRDSQLVANKCKRSMTAIMT